MHEESELNSVLNIINQWKEEQKTEACEISQVVKILLLANFRNLLPNL